MDRAHECPLDVLDGLGQPFLFDACGFARGFLELYLHAATQLGGGLPRESHRRETADVTLTLPDQVNHARDQAGGLTGARSRLDQDVLVEHLDDQLARGLIRRQWSRAGRLAGIRLLLLFWHRREAPRRVSESGSLAI